MSDRSRPGPQHLLLAVDYDGTLATDGRVSPDVIRGLERLRRAGRHVVLVTGRELDDVLRVFPRVDVCSYAVAENGAVVYDPEEQRATLLADPPPASFRELLRRERVPFSTGRVIIGSNVFYRHQVLRAIRAAEVPLQLAFNKDSLMVLPSGIDKARGLRTVLQLLDIAPDRAVGVGDAENDRALFHASGCGVAVANALQSLKDHADLVTAAANGRGVLEVIERLLAPLAATSDGAATA